MSQISGLPVQAAMTGLLIRGKRFLIIRWGGRQSSLNLTAVAAWRRLASSKAA